MLIYVVYFLGLVYTDKVNTYVQIYLYKIVVTAPLNAASPVRFHSTGYGLRVGESSLLARRVDGGPNGRDWETQITAPIITPRRGWRHLGAPRTDTANRLNTPRITLRRGWNSPAQGTFTQSWL